MATKQKGSRVSDQKQEVKEELMSKQSTMVLMKNLLRISISSICFSRQLFNDDCFKTKDYAGMGLKVLDVTSESDGVVMTSNVEAFRLQNWLERGVFAALEKEFVESVKFGIFTRHPKTGKDLNIESYEFRLQYADEHRKAEVNGIELSKESIRTQAQRFLRSLIEFSKTLDDIPESRWLTIMLKYNKNAPKDYEPEQFEETSATVFNMSIENPLKFDFTEVVTPHINLNVTFEGMESLNSDDLSSVRLGDLTGGEKPLPIDTTNYFSAISYANEICTDTAVETFVDPRRPEVEEADNALASQSQEEEMQFSQKKNGTAVSFADPVSQDDSLCNTLSQQSSACQESVMEDVRRRIESFLHCSEKGELKSDCSRHIQQFNLVVGFRDRQNAVSQCLDRLIADGRVKKLSNSSKYILCEKLPPAKQRQPPPGPAAGKKKRGGVDPGLLLPKAVVHPPAPPNSINVQQNNAENWNPNISQLTESHDSDSFVFQHEPPRKRRAIISESICLQRGLNDFPAAVAHSQLT